MALAERELNGYVNEHVGIGLEQWFKENKGLIQKVARYYTNRHQEFMRPYDYDDLYQIGCLTLTECYYKYKKINDNVDFKKYVVSYIHFKIERFIQFKSKSVHIPLQQRSTSKTNVFSLNFKIVGKDGTEDMETIDTLYASELIDFDNVVANVFSEILNDDEKTIFKLRMNLIDNAEIARRMGVSRPTINNKVGRIKEKWNSFNGEGRKEGEYEQWLKVAKEKGIGRRIYQQRVKSGMSCKRAATQEIRGRK